jgi:hypothetical protein
MTDGWRLFWHWLTCLLWNGMQWRVDVATKKAVCVRCGFVYPGVTFDIDDPHSPP